jgi:mono/diheme cytochrome c family protein
VTRASTAIVLTLTALPLGVEPVRAAEPSGRDLFVEYCATCHGADAKGHGPMASELKRPPADLTRLGDRFGVPLAKPKLVEVIDGRDMVRAHGTSEMPVWGKRMLQEVPPGAGTEAHKRGMIQVIVDWLDTVQEK